MSIPSPKPQNIPHPGSTMAGKELSIFCLPNEILIKAAEYITEPIVEPKTPWPYHQCLRFLIPLSLTNHFFARITSTVFQKAACLMGNSSKALYFAATNGDEKMVRLLLAKAQGIKIKRGQGPNAIELYSPGIHDETFIRYVMGEGPNFRHGHYSVLEWAVVHKNKMLMRRALEKGADIHGRSDFMIRFSSVGGWILHMAARQGDEISVGLLLKRGVDTNTQDRVGLTTLFSAAVHSQPGVVKQLLKNGADINIKNSKGLTALACTRCLATSTKQRDAFWLLLEAAAIDENPEDCLLHLAIAQQHLELVKRLLQSGYDVNAHEYTPNHLAVERTQISIVGVPGYHFRKNTPLHLAVATGNEEIARLLLAHGADINVCNDHEYTALDLAGGEECMMKYGDKMVRVLLEHRPDINVCHFGRPELLKVGFGWTGFQELGLTHIEYI